MALLKNSITQLKKKQTNTSQTSRKKNFQVTLRIQFHPIPKQDEDII